VIRLVLGAVFVVVSGLAVFAAIETGAGAESASVVPPLDAARSAGAQEPVKVPLPAAAPMLVCAVAALGLLARRAKAAR
jgi:hypothetical protein